MTRLITTCLSINYKNLDFLPNYCFGLPIHLKDRSQRVGLDGPTSEWVPVTSGVPQGSSLGPLLFLLFIYDMPDCTEHSILSLFADDAKCFRIINNIEDCEQLRRDLNSLYECSQVWKLNFNVLHLQEMLLLLYLNIILRYFIRKYIML